MGADRGSFTGCGPISPGSPGADTAAATSDSGRYRACASPAAQARRVLVGELKIWHRYVIRLRRLLLFLSITGTPPRQDLLTVGGVAGAFLCQDHLAMGSVAGPSTCRFLLRRHHSESLGRRRGQGDTLDMGPRPQPQQRGRLDSGEFEPASRSAAAASSSRRSVR